MKLIWSLAYFLHVILSSDSNLAWTRLDLNLHPALFITSLGEQVRILTDIAIANSYQQYLNCK